jgi:AraC-like DNA-binding protein
METGHLTAGLAFAETGDVVCTSGLINGRVALFGPLSRDKVTVGVGLRLGAGTRHWLNDVETGNVGVFLPGDEHDSLYTPGSLYATVTLKAEKLEEEAAQEDLILNRDVLGGTGVHHRNLAPDILARLRTSFQMVHGGCTIPCAADVGKTMLAAVISHLARPPHLPNGRTHPGCHGKIVERARRYIQEHLGEPMSVDEIAAAAYTSRRTLFRAFADILDDTPRAYVRRLRLHRIRHDLAGDAERACTIALIANQWGISDLGRMSGWYRKLFGERPSDTLAHPPTSSPSELARTP